MSSSKCSIDRKIALQFALAGIALLAIGPWRIFFAAPDHVSSHAHGTGSPRDLLAFLDVLAQSGFDSEAACIEKLTKPRLDSNAVVSVLCDFLSKADGSIDERVVGAALDALRSLMAVEKSARESLGNLLSYRCALYQGRDKMIVIRLRAYIMATLGEIGVPDSAMSYLFDSLALIDERMTAIEIGAAARAAGSLGGSGRPFIPYLLTVAQGQFSDDEFSLESMETDFPPQEATTAQIEAIRALGHICSPQDQQAMKVLQRIAELNGGINNHVVREARAAVINISDSMKTAEKE